MSRFPRFLSSSSVSADAPASASFSNTRRHFLRKASAVSAIVTTGGAGVLGAGAFGLPRPAAAATAQYTLKYGNYQPMEHPNNVYAAKMAAKIAIESNGKIDFQIYPNSQLGSDTDMLSQLRSGALDFMALTPSTVGMLMPVQQISALGFVFKDYDHVWAAMDGDLGAMLRQQLAQKTSIFAFDKIWDNGFRQITSSVKPIASPDDLRSLKIRVPPTQLLTSMFRAFGSSPTTVSMHDVYPSLQTHIVDAQENPLVLISASKLYEVQKYCSMTNHVWDGFWLLGNQKKFAALPKDLQEIVTRNVNEAAIAQRADTMAQNASLMEKLKQGGLAFNSPAPEAFREKLITAGFYTEWKKRFGDDAWALLERYSGKIG